LGGDVVGVLAGVLPPLPPVAAAKGLKEDATVYVDVSSPGSRAFAGVVPPLPLIAAVKGLKEDAGVDEDEVPLSGSRVKPPRLPNKLDVGGVGDGAGPPFSPVKKLEVMTDGLGLLLLPLPPKPPKLGFAAEGLEPELGDIKEKEGAGFGAVGDAPKLKTGAGFGAVPPKADEH
jgi:hypothetical protein